MITIEEFKKKQSETSRLIGLDLGSKRIGVSICDEKQSIAIDCFSSQIDTPILFEPRSKPINLEVSDCFFLNSSIVIILYILNLSDSLRHI